MTNFQGAWPALLTPFTSDNQVNAAILPGSVDYHLAKGAGRVDVCGSAGQGVFMSVEERKLVAETVLSHVNGRVPVVVHIGTMVSVDAVELARHAAQHGASAISSILPPLYRTTESLYNYFAALASAAPDLPLWPYIFGGPADAVTLMRRLMQISNVAGTKYTGPNMYEFGRIVALRSEKAGWTVFSGMDEQCVFAAMSGASGNIGSTLNVMLSVYREIHTSHRAGDVARSQAMQAKANQITGILYGFGFDGALKAAMKMLGFDCGQPRLPKQSLPKAEHPALRLQLEAAGFFELGDL